MAINTTLQIVQTRACYGSTYAKIGTIQRRLAWPLQQGWHANSWSVPHFSCWTYCNFSCCALSQVKKQVVTPAVRWSTAGGQHCTGSSILWRNDFM